ncbi:hypothetical protein TNCV_2302741 [Trichonephila clavipes]|nr:hypothetical protein TNCV_2302741 [Trichonephila clavipes]
MPKSNTQRGKEFRERKKIEHQVQLKKQKNSANSSSATVKSRSEYMREYPAREKNIAEYSLNAEFNGQ